MNTKIIYEVNETVNGCIKGESIRVIAAYDDGGLAVVLFADTPTPRPYAVIECGIWSDKLQKVSLKKANLIFFPNLKEALHNFTDKITEEYFEV